MSSADKRFVDLVREIANPLEGGANDFDPLLAAIGERRFVLLGEATHGTHEFYQSRADITRRLIEEKGFNAVVVEADWPDAYRVNRFVRGVGDAADADAALGGFKRFPQWMWRNDDVRSFVEWLRSRNRPQQTESGKVGFYGMDLYSLYGSIEVVLRYLDKVDPAAASVARQRYGCFEHFSEDPQAYGRATGFELERSCEDEVVRQLIELRRRAEDYRHRDGRVAQDEYFYTEQNARLIKNAEEYYRSMFQGDVSSWNLRDRHMVETIDALVQHLGQTDGRAKFVVWAHNSHLGDARATEMGEAGEWNVGQLMRERFGDDAFLVGFTTHTGTVTAASNWDEPAELMRVRPSLQGSFERLFHETGIPRSLLLLRNIEIELDARLERAIGVIYRPETERRSHYFHAMLQDQFDAVIHFDQTRAVTPLERTPAWSDHEVPEAYPTGL